LSHGAHAEVVASGTEFGQVGEKYGWLVEIDPDDPEFQPRCKPGEHLVAYMGDDRRGGHTWKYMSSAIVRRRHSTSNSKLLEDGTLHVARYHLDDTWHS
jgi:secreted PhoX family phosphatase